MIRSTRMLPLFAAAILSAVLLGWGMLSNAPHSHVQGPIPTAPTSPTNYPSCTVEEGAGQALCVWDGTSRGNGMGNIIVSGDCAPYTEAVKALCVQRHSQGQAGIDAVGECTQMYFDGNATKAEECIRNS